MYSHIGAKSTWKRSIFIPLIPIFLWYRCPSQKSYFSGKCCLLWLQNGWKSSDKSNLFPINCTINCAAVQFPHMTHRGRCDPRFRDELTWNNLTAPQHQTWSAASPQEGQTTAASVNPLHKTLIEQQKHIHVIKCFRLNLQNM